VDVPRAVIAIIRHRAGYFRVDQKRFEEEFRSDRARDCRVAAETLERLAKDLEARTNE